MTEIESVRPDWRWQAPKTASVSLRVLQQGDRRMEAEYYLASGYGIRVSLAAKTSGWLRLSELVVTTMPPRLKGVIIPSANGTPYLSATQVFDARPVPRRWMATDQIPNVNELFVERGQILVTRSGNVGRTTLATNAHLNTIISDDLLRLNPTSADWWGWVYAYLRAPSVRQMMKSSHYGHIIKHLDSPHLNDLPIVKVNSKTRKHFNDLAERVIFLRGSSLAHIHEAEALFEQSLGQISELPRRHEAGFTRQASELWGSRSTRLEAARFNPVAEWADESIASGSTSQCRLGDLIDRVYVPGRFKHVYGAEGIPYLDSSQIMEVAPDIEKRVLSLPGEKRLGYLVDRGTILMPCSGQVHGIVGSVVLATEWHEAKVLTNHILRIVPRTGSGVRAGYLVTVLGHPTLGRPRVVRNAFGSSVPEIDPGDVADILIPRLGRRTESRIADLMEESAVLRAEADRIDERIASEAENNLNDFLHTE